MKRTVLFVSILLYSISAFSQDEYDYGYIVTQKGDTIKGELKRSLMSDASDKMKFKYNDGKEINVRPEDYAGYCIGNGNDFRSIPGSLMNGAKFAEVLVDGRLCLMRFSTFKYDAQTTRYNETVHYVVQKERDPTSLKEMSRLGFKKMILKFVADDPELVDLIEKKEYRYDDLREIVEEYNDHKKKG